MDVRNNSCNTTARHLRKVTEGENNSSPAPQLQVVASPVHSPLTPDPRPRSGQNRLDTEEGVERDGDSSFAVESAADQTISGLHLVEPYAIGLAVSQARVVDSEIREKVPNAYHLPGFSGTARMGDGHEIMRFLTPMSRRWRTGIDPLPLRSCMQVRRAATSRSVICCTHFTSTAASCSPRSRRKSTSRPACGRLLLDGRERRHGKTSEKLDKRYFRIPLDDG